MTWNSGSILTMPAPIPVVLTSQGVCQSCRIGKQRCDRSLPSCSRCASKLLRCNYDRTDALRQSQHHTSHGIAVVVRRPCCLDLSDHGARELLEAARVDNGSCSLARLFSHILDTAKITTPNLMDDYFATIHSWFPIIDEESFRSRIRSWPQLSNAALATVMWSVFLVTRRPCKDGKHSASTLLYQTTKQMFMLQAAGKPTLELLQVGLLITYYACGHGLPREAYMTLSTCATIAQLIGLDFGVTRKQPGIDSEHSACQWAVILLDRTIVLSNYTDPTPLVLPPHSSLNTECLASFLSSSELRRTFDVSSRVSLLLGSAFGYSYNPLPNWLTGSKYNDTYDQVEELVRHLIYTNGTGSDSYLYCESTSLAVSTLLALQVANPGGENPISGSKEALLLQSTLRIIKANLNMSTYILQEENGSGISIVALCSLSRAATILLRIRRQELSDQDIETLCSNLRRFSTRWAICGKYLEYIEAAIM